MIKILDFFINRYYFKTLHQKDLIEIKDHSKYIKGEIKLFQNDKIIYSTKENEILIYNILEKKLLCKYRIPYYFFHKKKIEIFTKNLFIVNDLDLRYLSLFELKENKIYNKYYIKLKFQIREKANDIFIEANKIICLNNEYINIYKLLDNYIQLQTKITIPFLISNRSIHKGISIGEKKIIFEFNNNFLGIWNLENYKLIFKNLIENRYIQNSNYRLIEIISYNTDQIVFNYGDYIFLYSLEKNEFLRIIKLEIFIYGFVITKNKEIYLNDKNNIYKLDINYKTIHKLIRYKNEFINSLIILDYNNINTFIASSKNKIIIFHSSAFLTIKQDFKYYLFIFFFLFLYGILTKSYQFDSILKEFFYNFISSGIILYIYKIFDVINENEIQKKNYFRAKIFILYVFTSILTITYKNKNKLKK